MRLTVVQRNNLKKECGTCTKCCDGTVAGVIKGHKMFPGQPCFFLGKSGCNDYENRPNHPCKTYQCLWLSDPSVPDFIKPENAEVIVDIETYKGKKYLKITKPNKNIDNIINYAKEYAIKNNMSLIWFEDESNNVNYFGDEKLCLEIISETNKQIKYLNII